MPHWLRARFLERWFRFRDRSFIRRGRGGGLVQTGWGSYLFVHLKMGGFIKLSNHFWGAMYFCAFQFLFHKKRNNTEGIKNSFRSFSSTSWRKESLQQVFISLRFIRHFGFTQESQEYWEQKFQSFSGSKHGIIKHGGYRDQRQQVRERWTLWTGIQVYINWTRVQIFVLWIKKQSKIWILCRKTPSQFAPNV